MESTHKITYKKLLVVYLRHHFTIKNSRFWTFYPKIEENCKNPNIFPKNTTRSLVWSLNIIFRRNNNFKLPRTPPGTISRQLLGHLWIFDFCTFWRFYHVWTPSKCPCLCPEQMFLASLCQQVAILLEKMPRSHVGSSLRFDDPSKILKKWLGGNSEIGDFSENKKEVGEKVLRV